MKKLSILLFSILLPLHTFAISASVPCIELRSTLSQGSTDTGVSTEVRKLQIFLFSQGLLTTQPNGYFGRATKNAVIAFQSENNIASTGSVGPATRALIKAMTCTRTSQGSSQSQSSNTQNSPNSGVSVSAVADQSGAVSGVTSALCGADVVDNPAVDAGPVLQSCFLSNKDKGIIELLPGRYYISRTIDVGNLSNTMIRTKGVSSGPACLQPGSAPCAVLFATSNNKGPVVFKSEGASKLTLSYFAIDGNRTSRWSPGVTPSWVNGKAFNAQVAWCSSCAFKGFSSVRAPQGTGLEFIGNNAVFDTTLFSDNGWQLSDWYGSNPNAGAFADGLTAIIAENIIIRNSEFSNNSDINLILGDAPNAIIENNTIKSTNKFVFAGLMLDNFMGINNVQGRYGGTVVRDNTINCSDGLCGIGIDIGPYLWYSKKNGTDIPVERVTGGKVSNNIVTGARQGILIAGATGVTVSDNTIATAGTFRGPVNTFLKLPRYTTTECITKPFSISQGDTATITGNKNSSGQIISASSNELRECHPYDLEYITQDTSPDSVTPAVTFPPTVSVAQGSVSVSDGSSWSSTSATGGVAFTFSNTEADSCSLKNSSGQTFLSNTSRTTVTLPVGTYTYRCSNTAGTKEVLFSVKAPTPTPAPSPTLSLSWTPSSIDTGSSATIAWSSTNASYCNVSHPGGINPWDNAPTSYSRTYQNLTTGDTTTVTCYNQAGQSVAKTVTLTVNPVAPIIASITSAELAQGWYYGDADQKKPGTPSTWILINSGTRSAMWKAPTPTPAPSPTLSLSWTPSSIDTGSSATIAWSSTNASHCNVSHPGGINPWDNAPTSYSRTYQNLTTGDTTTVTCYNQAGQSVAKTVTLAVADPTTIITDIYKRVLGRTPDASGLAYWVNQLTQKYKTKEQIETDIRNSDEAYIISLYKTELGRFPDQAGLIYFMNQLSSKSRTRAQVAEDIRNSPEAVQYRNSRVTMENHTPTVLGVSTSATCTNLPINLHRGMEKPSVSLLQSFLLEKGFMEGEVTGFYGDKTIEAVKDYQASVGLPVTGMTYSLTREAMRMESCR